MHFLSTKNYFTTIENQKIFLFNFSYYVVESVINEIIGSHRHLTETPSDEKKAELLSLLETQSDVYIAQFSGSTDIYESFVDYTFAEFNDFCSEPFDNLFIQLFDNNALVINDGLKVKLKQLVYYFLKTKEKLTNYTGLIFTGFGEDEIYTQLLAVNVSMVLDNRLRFYQDTGNQGLISNENEGAICPFAQIDVINTILTGIDPTLDATYNANFEASFTKYNQEILNILGTATPELSALIQALDIKALVKEYSDKNNETKSKNYIIPLMNAVSNLSKDDLAEMAESLIYLTYLKRRITFAEESVGGPVDVAIISKGDGFIWIKRKHYFKPELNKHFFDNYLNK